MKAASKAILLIIVGMLSAREWLLGAERRRMRRMHPVGLSLQDLLRVRGELLADGFDGHERFERVERELRRRVGITEYDELSGTPRLRW